MSGNESEEDIIEILREKVKDKYGIICLNCLLINCKIEEIEDFIHKHKIKISKSKVYTRLEYFKLICYHFYFKLKLEPQLQEKYHDAIHFLGDALICDPNFKKYLSLLDFYAQQDLIDAFADFCADLGINVYDLRTVRSDYSVDLYLTKKKPRLRTEIVILRTGFQLTEKEYERVLEQLKKSSEIASWNVFVTSSFGALNIGLERMVKDMETANTWLYVVCPYRKRVYGITKGKKNPNYNSKSRDEFLTKLPKNPIRAQSNLMELSDFYFKEGESYNSKDFIEYEVLEEIEHNKLILQPQKKPKYEDIFRSIIIMTKTTGIPMISLTSKKDPVNEFLTSSFLSAMDTFVSQIGGTSSMREISYKEFYVQAAYGINIKVALFLSEPTEKSLVERLNYFTHLFEENYNEQILKFNDTGDKNLFDDNEILPLIKKILDI